MPLVALLLMWMHVQRVPKAQTQPPRPIALAVLAMLCLLALLQPVVSQGGAANLAAGRRPRSSSTGSCSRCTRWCTAWPLAAVWALVGIGTLVLLALPWLPPRRGPRAALPRHDAPRRDARSLARAGETLLEAGLRAGLALPYDCRAGGCGQCVCTVLNGRVDPGPYQPAALTDAMRARGQALMCCAVALDDVELEVDVPTLGKAGAARRWHGRVESVERIADDVMRLRIGAARRRSASPSPPASTSTSCSTTARGARSRSPTRRTTTPSSSCMCGRIPGGLFTTRVFTTMQPGDTHRLRRPARPLHAARERAADPVRGRRDRLRADQEHRRGRVRARHPAADAAVLGRARSQGPVPLELAERWQREHPNFRVVPVLSTAAADDPWTGRRGLVHEAMLADHPDLTGYEVYACGSVQMVEAAVPAFIAQGLDERFCISDAFTPAAA